MLLDRFKWTWKMQQELLTLPAVQQLLLKQEQLYQEHVPIFMEARSFPTDVSSSLLTSLLCMCPVCVCVCVCVGRRHPSLSCIPTMSCDPPTSAATACGPSDAAWGST